MSKKRPAKSPAIDEHSALEMHMKAVQEIARLDEQVAELREQGKKAQANTLDKRRRKIADVLAQLEAARRPKDPGEKSG